MTTEPPRPETPVALDANGGRDRPEMNPREHTDDLAARLQAAANTTLGDVSLPRVALLLDSRQHLLNVTEGLERAHRAELHLACVNVRLTDENERLLIAVRYACAPTLGWDRSSNGPIVDFVWEADERAVRLALKTVIEIAQRALPSKVS